MIELFQQESFGQITPQMEEGFQLLWTNNNNLLQLTNTLLDVYRYESGRKVLNFSPVDMAELIQSVVQDLQALADQKGLEIRTHIENITLPGVRLELYRVLTNLIGNAIKFTDEGSITVNLKPDSESVCIEIIDTGIGISEEEQSALFSRFRQGSHGRAGSGLGLYLSRQVIEAHGGTLSVRLQQGKGSTFKFSLSQK